jgi:arylsulfatase A-like enzyme
MDFQAVSVGQKYIEASVGKGGYLDAAGTPSAPLLSEIEYVDAAIGDMVNALKDTGNFDDTLIIVTAKHGQSPIDPNLYKRNGTITPATLLANVLPFSESPTNPTGIGPTEDDVSLIWLKNGVDVVGAVTELEHNAAGIGLGQLFYGPTLALNYNKPGLEPGEDPRTPDIIVTPNVGVTYSNSKSKQAEHGGFSHDDTNVVLLVANPYLAPMTVSAPTATAQVAPTILTALGLDPSALQAVRKEGTAILPGIALK